MELGDGAFRLLMITGFASGAVSMWAFRRLTNPTLLRTSLNRIAAHLFELRLFAEEPALVLRAQANLLSANWDFLRTISRASVILALPFAVLMVAVDAICGRAPLRSGQPAIVTVQCVRSGAFGLPNVELEAPEGFAIETTALRVPSSSQISWRVNPQKAVTGELRIHSNGQVLVKSVSSRPGLQWLAATRAGSLSGFLIHPLELPFSNPSIRAISIGYPPAQVFRCNWGVWFSLGSVAGALGFVVVFRRR